MRTPPATLCACGHPRDVHYLGDLDCCEDFLNGNPCDCERFVEDEDE